jgi:hypothetical protein
VYLLSPSLIINEIATQLHLSITIINMVIFANIIVLYVHLSKTISISSNFKRYLITIFLIQIYLVMVWVVVYDGNIYGAGPRSFIKVMTLILFSALIMRSRQFDIVKFNVLFINIAFLLSLSSIFLYIGYNLDYVSLSWERLEGHYSYMWKGFGGYLNTIGNAYGTNYGSQIRSQSFFSEPANFAQYLTIPLFFALQQFILNRNMMSIIKLLTISVALILTFSVANIFGVIFAILLYTVLSSIKNPGKNKVLNRSIYLIASALVVIYSLQLYSSVNDLRGQTVMAKGTDYYSFFVKIERMGVYLSEINDHPMGNIEFIDDNKSNPGLIFNILIIGGYPLFLLFMPIVYSFFRTMWRSVKYSKYQYLYLGPFAYILPILWEGEIREYYLLFILILFPIISEMDKKNETVLL